MKKAVIWDLDGTLLNSYHVIVESISQTFAERGINIPKEEIHRYTIEFSTKSLFCQTACRYGLDSDLLQQHYRQISAEKYKDIILMEQALDVLAALENMGVEHYVFTHRGRTTIPVLDHLGITGYFREILTSQSGFARKPDPEAICYLIDKFGLDPVTTWYIGDRAIDMACAKNAGISAILYQPEGSFDVSGGGEDYVVNHLIEIADIV